VLDTDGHWDGFHEGECVPFRYTKIIDVFKMMDEGSAM
jgi:hypothetical protein